MSDVTYDYRIVRSVDDDFGGEKFTLATVVYEGDAVKNVESIAEFVTIEGVYNFTDRVYKASLKPVLEKLEDGTYL